MRVGFAFAASLGAKEQICSQDKHLDDINHTFIDCSKLSCGKQALSISNRRSSSAWGREVDYGYLQCAAAATSLLAHGKILNPQELSL